MSPSFGPVQIVSDWTQNIQTAGYDGAPTVVVS